MNTPLQAFKSFNISKDELCHAIGDDLYNAKVSVTEVVEIADVTQAVQKYMNSEITLPALLDWTNILMFTDLFDFADGCDGSIASVLSFLETLDEDGVTATDDDFKRMIQSLENNTEF
jgi:hypothetical protein